VTDAPVIVTLADCRASKVFCRAGAILFFKKHNLDFKSFIKNGISSDDVAHIDDAMMHKIIEVARGRK